MVAVRGLVAINISCGLQHILVQWKEYDKHIVYRVPGFLSSRPVWLPLPPHSQTSVASSFGSKVVGGGRGKHSLAGEGAGGANSDEGTGTLVLLVKYKQGGYYINP